MKSLTRVRKLKVGDTLYVFQVPKETSLDPIDIIKAGRVMMIKIGIQSAVDPKGTLLGRRVSGYNCMPIIEVLPYKEIEYEIGKAVTRTINKMNAEEKNPIALLPRLGISKHKSRLIQKSQTEPPFYYITAEAFCDNCKGVIEGFQVLAINSDGKVGAESPFQPTNPDVVQHPVKKKKWLHRHCAPVSVHEETEQKPVSETIKTDDLSIQTNESVLLDILTNQERFSAEFARGASYMYYLLNKESKS